MNEALELYLSEMKITTNYFKNVGFDVFSDEPKINCMFLILVLDMLFYEIVHVYSLYYYRDSFLELFFSIATMGFAVQILSILSSFNSNLNMFWPLHLSLIEYHKIYGSRSVLHAHNKKVKKFIDLFTKMCGSCVGLCVIYPIIVLLYEKKKVLSFGFILPFLDPKSNIGFMINFLNQSLQVVIAEQTYLTFCRIYWLLFGNALIRIEILKEATHELKENILNDVDEDDYQQKLTLKLKEIVELHLEYLSSIDSLEMIGNKIVFIIAITTIANVAITLLVVSFEFWYAGCGTIAVATFTLMALCLLGTILEVKVEEFCAELYEVPWYAMPLRHQNNFLYILMASQMRKPITFWDYADVNVSSFLDIYNKIYTGFMLLVKSKK